MKPFLPAFYYITRNFDKVGSIPSCVTPKTFKMVLDTPYLSSKQYEVRIKGKVEQSRERSNALTQHLDVVAIEKGAFWSPTLLFLSSN